MSDLLTLKRPTRLVAALIALCYFWLSAATSFQHTHRLGEDIEETTAVSVSAVRMRGNTSAKSPVVAAAHSASATRCIACDWQATNVSPALPLIQWKFTPPAAPRAITTMPRYLRAHMLANTSRGPPTV